MSETKACSCPVCKNHSSSLPLVAGLLFFIVASPYVFKLVNQLTNSVGLNILEQGGTPNMVGLALHTLVFVVLLVLVNKLR